MNHQINDNNAPIGGLGAIRIGCGAGFSGDRLEPAIILAEQGNLDYLVLECLAERTIALAQKRKRADATKGYDPLLERRIEGLLPILAKNNIRLITNMGAANPIEGAKKIVEIASKQGISVKVAAVIGDELSDKLVEMGDEISKFNNEDFAIALISNHSSLNTPPTSLNTPLSSLNPHHPSLISANAYMGVEGILEALQSDAQIIITGRVADPSLFLAPMIHEFGWATDDYNLLGQGTIVGHLLECAGQITGGYFADPITKPVTNLDTLGHPFADVFADGSAIISKVSGTGGVVNLATVKEQLLYEVVNPHAYLTPDVSANFTTVQLEQMGADQVKVWGGTGQEKPSTLKVSVGYQAGFLGEGEISYAGANALARAKLAGDTLEKRLKADFPDLRTDYVGVSAIHRTDFNHHLEPYEVRLRLAANAATAQKAAIIGEEVEALYTNGPAGGGGARKYVTELVGIVSVLVDREKVNSEVILFSPLTPRGGGAPLRPSNGGVKDRIQIDYNSFIYSSLTQKTTEQTIATKVPPLGARGLYGIAHSRAGDKGNTSTLSLIPYDAKDYELLYQKVTVERVKEHLKDIVSGEIVRYELPNISSLLFVCQDALLTGVTTSLAIDTHGKALSYALLEMEIE